MGASIPVSVTSFVGRSAQAAEVVALLGAHPLVTITGPGGVGKTRLAAAVAPDAVAVALAELREPELVAAALAERLGLGDQTTRTPVDMLVDHLGQRTALIVLDNCEHLVDACAELVSALIAGCPGVRVLATSRQSLGVPGEWLVPLAPLPVPAPGTPLAELAAAPVVRLLVDRATAVVPGFAVTERNAEDVVRLCAALDGLPLAVELAAVRLRSLSVGQLADRLADRFSLLDRGRAVGPARHSTIHALIEWSHDLCTPGERLLWARASVFPGAFDLDAAEQVCAGGGLAAADVLDAVTGLIDKSVLQREEHRGLVRYRMLEMVRQHGEQRLRGSGGEAAVRARHRDRVAALVDGFAAGWFGPGQVDWIRRVRRAHADLRRALDFCAGDPAEAAEGLRVAAAAKEFWMAHGLTAEGRLWLGRLLAAAPPDAPARGRALWLLGFLAFMQGDRDACRAALDAVPDTDPLASAYRTLTRGYLALVDADDERAALLFQEAVDALGAAGDRGGQVWATCTLGLALARAGDPAAGRQVLVGAIAQCQAIGEVCWRAWALWALSALEYLAGEPAAAREAGLEVMRLQRRVDGRTVVTLTLTTLAGAATHLGEHRRAARLLGAATAAARALGTALTDNTAFAGHKQRDTAAVIEAIGAQAAGEEFAAGLATGIDAAVAFALGESAQAPARGPAVGLTAREAEVAGLVAQGLTDREIAARLVIAPRTAEAHVANVRAKLGVRTRAQVAAWVAAGG
ncbi:ATP-binding protein [Actinokineospora bangkokensis]|uniref:ATP-binding protein n=1 Tax=Actinokineospora bangkokensis TaxID=1193682 RepID=UPI000B17D455|nr:LuxR C-terminal-related transcriptional regulator [Actinokineospora bangkokensis]